MVISHGRLYISYRYLRYEKLSLHLSFDQISFSFCSQIGSIPRAFASILHWKKMMECVPYVRRRCQTGTVPCMKSKSQLPSSLSQAVKLTKRIARPDVVPDRVEDVYPQARNVVKPSISEVKPRPEMTRCNTAVNRWAPHGAGTYDKLSHLKRY